MQPVISFSICFALASVQLILVHIRILRVRLCDSRNNQMCIMCQQEASPASLLPFAAMVDDQVLLHLDISAMFLAHLQAKQSDKHVFMICIPNYDIYNGYITCMAGRWFHGTSFRYSAWYGTPASHHLPNSLSAFEMRAPSLHWLRHLNHHCWHKQRPNPHGRDYPVFPATESRRIIVGHQQCGIPRI